MSFPEANLATLSLPQEYAAIPLSPQSGVLNVCLVARRQPDPVGGHLVLLRGTLDAAAYLGCLTDLSGQVHEWLEVWAQSLDGFKHAAETMSVRREALTNSVLDERWVSQFQAWQKARPEMVLCTGWETQSPPPTVLDAANLKPIQLKDKQSGNDWLLCKDDALLRKHGLPEYATTLHRYLYQPKAGEKTPFVAATTGSPRCEQSVDPGTVFPSGAEIAPFNPAGGFILVRRHDPMTLESLIDLLGGKPWPGVAHGASQVKVGAAAETSQANGAADVGWLFLRQQGRTGRFVERFHLKIQLMMELLSEVRTFIAKTQRPLLNLRPESFAVQTPVNGRWLAALWRTRPVLVDAGQAVALKIPLDNTQYYLPAEPRMNVYQPAVVGQIPAGRGDFQIERLTTGDDGASTLEGTLYTQQLSGSVHQHDLIWMSLFIRGGRLDIYAQLESKERAQYGQLKFRATGQRFAPDLVKTLEQAQGVQIPDVQFEILPRLSSPCDLFSLGVLAARLFLVNPKPPSPKSTTLSVALGELNSLARRLGAQPPGEGADAKAAPLRVRIEALVKSEPQYLDSLGPHRLADEELTPQQALEMLPAELWWDTLAAIMKMFFTTPGAHCANCGDAPDGAIEKVFDGAWDDFDSLLIRSRSILFIDWNSNREIHGLIEQFRGPG